MDVLTQLFANIFDKLKASNPILAVIIISVLIGAQYYITNNPNGMIPENIATIVLMVLSGLTGSRTRRFLDNENKNIEKKELPADAEKY